MSTKDHDFTFLPDIAKSEGLDENYYASAEYLTSPQFKADCAQSAMILEEAIVELSNLPCTTLRASAILLGQLGQALKDVELSKSMCAAGVQTLAVSATTFYAHPKFVHYNFTKSTGRQVGNTGLLHEAMHYVDGDAMVSIDLQERYKFDVEAGLVSQKAIKALSNLALDICHDSGLHNLFSKDQTLSKYCSGTLAGDHAQMCLGQTSQIFNEVIKMSELQGKDIPDDILPGLERWQNTAVSQDKTKLQLCTELIDLFMRIPKPDPEDGDDGDSEGDGNGGDSAMDQVEQHVVADPAKKDANGNDVPQDYDTVRSDAEEAQNANMSKAAQMCGDTGALIIVKAGFKPVRRPVKWSEMLARASTTAAKGGKPDIRKPYVPELQRGIILPTKRNQQSDAITILDVSYSVIGQLDGIQKFLTELRNAMHQKVRNMSIIPFDDKVHPTLHYTPSTADDLASFQTPGGGGTLLDPALQQAFDEKLVQNTHMMIIVTDLYLFNLPPAKLLPAQSHNLVWLITKQHDEGFAKKIRANRGKYGQMFVVE